MRFLMMVCSGGPDDHEPDETQTSPEAWVAEMDGRGVRVLGDRLRPSTDATTVRVRDGELAVTDGPFAETKEQLGGFDILECRDLAEAIEVASKHPVARFGTLELRPFWAD